MDRQRPRARPAFRRAAMWTAIALFAIGGAVALAPVPGPGRTLGSGASIFVGFVLLSVAATDRRPPRTASRR